MPTFDPACPYNGLPPLSPKADIETRAILKRCIAARSALAELKQAGALMPNQAVLVNAVPLREARDSSAIEGIVTTDDALFRHAALPDRDADADTKEILRCRAAILAGYRRLRDRPLATAAAVEICRTIRGVEEDVRRTPGAALRNAATGWIVYTPPQGEALLRDKLANWEAFLHGETGTDPLIRMAVGHYQFEAIHPFSDGNGRTGRIINILYLVSEGLLDVPVLYLSRYLIERRDDYYRLLLDVTARDRWEAWVLFMLSAVEDTAKRTTAKIRAIRDLIDHTTEYIGAARPKIHSRELVELIFTQPYCRIAHLTGAGIARRVTAAKYLRALCAIGVLEEIKVGRDKLFTHPKFLRLLTSDENEFDPYG